jgi:hypothetical protein
MQEPIVLMDFRREAARADIVLLEGLEEPAAAAAVQDAVAGVPTVVAFGCSSELQARQRLGGLPLQPAGWDFSSLELPGSHASCMPCTVMQPEGCFTLGSSECRGCSP